MNLSRRQTLLIGRAEDEFSRQKEKYLEIKSRRWQPKGKITEVWGQPTRIKKKTLYPSILSTNTTQKDQTFKNCLGKFV